MVFIKCYCCDNDCVVFDVKSPLKIYTCQPCAIKVHDYIRPGYAPATVKAATDPRKGDSFPIPFWCVALDAVKSYNMGNKSASISAINKTDPPVDDYVCKSCNNSKCSKTEKSCWKCGTLITI